MSFEEIADWDEEQPGYDALVDYWVSIGADPDEAREAARKIYPETTSVGKNNGVRWYLSATGADYKGVKHA